MTDLSPEEELKRHLESISSELDSSLLNIDGSFALPSSPKTESSNKTAETSSIKSETPRTLIADERKFTILESQGLLTIATFFKAFTQKIYIKGFLWKKNMQSNDGKAFNMRE